MDTYGDMVTLLLCFFVLLYSMSTISEENWKALVMSFNPKALTQITATPGGSGPSADGDQSGVMPEPTESQDPDVSQEEIEADIEELYEALKAYAESSEAQGQISVNRDGGKIFVSFNETAFFDSNESVLRPESETLLDSVSEMFSGVARSIDEIVISGHTAQATPNAPNEVRKDRTLSSERATEVLIYIQMHTDPEVLDPGKLVSQGMGQWRPAATNDTSEGRAANRRVEMVISGRDLEAEAELAGSIQQYTTSSD